MEVFMTNLLLFIGAGLVAFSGVPYIVALLRHQVRPKLVSWAIWTVLAIILTLSALREGQIPSALLSSITIISCGTILILGWRRSTMRITTLDAVCLVGALAGLVAYFMLGGVAALIISVAVDALAYIPTLIHGYTDPDEESLASYAYAVAGEALVLGVALLSNATFAGLLYPVYVVVFNGLMTGLILVGRTVAASRAAYQPDEG
jgi:hypothetical protein